MAHLPGAINKSPLISATQQNRQGGTLINTVQILTEIEQARYAILSVINTNFDRIIASLEISEDVKNTLTDCGEGATETAVYEYAVPLTTNSVLFIGKTPIAVSFGTERVYVKAWRGVMTTILQHCCQESVYRKRLMKLRNKVKGHNRMFLSDKPDGLTTPIMIYKALYVEAHHGAEAMMKMLVGRLLEPINYDCSNINIIIKT